MSDGYSATIGSSQQSVAEGHAGIASAHPLATQAGVDCLQAGGNAFDALIVTAITLVVVEPMMSGILGVGLAMLSSESEGCSVCNFSGWVPQNFAAQEWSDSKSDALSIVSPQVPAGWIAIHEKYGTLPFKTLFASAIQYSEQGFLLTEANCYFLNFAKESVSQKMQFDYYQSNEFEVGDSLSQAKTAMALREIATNPQALTRGKVANAIKKTLIEHHSALTLADIEDDPVVWQSVLVEEVFGRRVAVPPPNSDAFIILRAAKLLEVDSIGALQHNSAEYVDAVAGVLKRVMKEGRSLGGDPKKWSERFSADKQHTTTLVTRDVQGNCAIMTQTLGGLFGSGVWVEEYGLPFNGAGSYFFDVDGETPASRRAAAGSQVPWSVSLVQIFDGDALEYAFGTPGGFTIQQVELQVLLNLLVFRMSLPEAIDAPRFFIDEREDITVEGRFSAEVVASLSDRGYLPKCLGDYSWRLGCVQGLACGEVATFVGDARRHAVAMAI
ncbi:MAG: gamma-glutamyltransferase [Halioglobus sp.]|nr:gamma-glutamyltransferase [Halioglobus sp.]